MPDGRAPRTSGPTARPSGPVARAAQSIKQRLVAAFTNRLPFKATALFFALVLWLVVSAEEPTSGVVQVQIVPSLDTSLQLIGEAPSVSAYVVGTRSDLLRLTATPPAIHFSIPADAPDSLRVRVDTLQLTMPSGVTVSVRDIEPDAVTLRFRAEASRTLPVRSQLRFVAEPGQVIAGSPHFDPESVRVVGSRQRVRMLDAVRTIATDLVVRDTLPILVPLDTSELGVRVTPAQVRVRVPTMPDSVPGAKVGSTEAPARRRGSS